MADEHPQQPHSPLSNPSLSDGSPPAQPRRVGGNAPPPANSRASAPRKPLLEQPERSVAASAAPVHAATDRSTLAQLFETMGWPIFLGLAAWVGFYALIHAGAISHPMAHRYFAGHEIEYAEMAMFFVGLAALLLKAGSLFGQYAGAHRKLLDPIPPGGVPASECAAYLRELKSLPARVQNHPLVARVMGLLDYTHRKGTADDLEDEIKYLSDIEAGKQQEGYALVRIVTWATPMLGFLGTVVGITMALGQLSGEQLIANPKEATEGLLEGLAVAFDTTALALVLAIALMFGMFLVQQIENQFLALVDRRVSDELVGRFHQLGTRRDPELASVRQMAEQVLQTNRQLVEQQAAIWQQSIDAAQQQWHGVLHTVGSTLEQSLAQALHQSMHSHAQALAQAEEISAQRSSRMAEAMQTSLRQNVELLAEQRQEMARQGDTLLKIVDATSHVAQLERVLNDNLQSLSGSRHFEEMVMSLSAAIHLLTTRLEPNGGERPGVQLQGDGKTQATKGRAA